MFIVMLSSNDVDSDLKSAQAHGIYFVDSDLDFVVEEFSLRIDSFHNPEKLY